MQTDVTLLANSQQCWMLHVKSVCTPCCLLLHVLGSCYCSVMAEHSATVLDLFAQVFQHCWGNTLGLHVISKVLWLVSFPQCTAGPNIVENCCTACTPLPTWTQQLPTLLTQQCRELLHLFARSLKNAIVHL